MQGRWNGWVGVAAPAVAMALATASAHAGVVPLVGVSLSAEGAGTQPIVGACTQTRLLETHPQAPVYSAALTGVSATATIRPTPSVEARIQGNVVCNSRAHGSSDYAIHVVGAAPNSMVPVRFSGLFESVVPQFAYAAVPVADWYTVDTIFSLTIGDYLRANSGLSVVATFHGRRFDSPTGTSSTGDGRIAMGYYTSGNAASEMTAQVEGIGTLRADGSQLDSYDSGDVEGMLTAAIRGDLQGQVFAQTDADGEAWISVTLFAEVDASALLSVGNMRSFIDPYFELDPQYLALHPGARLTPVSGFGNDPPGANSVPEPSAAVLSASTLALLTLFLGWQRHGRSATGRYDVWRPCRPSPSPTPCTSWSSTTMRSSATAWRSWCRAFGRAARCRWPAGSTRPRR